jgi:S1-C subfamily serine protease
LADVPPAYIEMHSGDRFPGVAIDYKNGQETPFDPLPPHLVVRSAQKFEPPENKPITEIRVALPFVRRIVWQRRGRQLYQPGTVFYRDGRSLAFRAVRFGAGQLHLLLSDGENRRLAWTDLAELHLPAVDSWAAHWDEVALVCPTIETRLFQVETTAGLVATASLARFVPRFEGNSAEPDRWVHGIQPAWSLDILWVPCREMVSRRGWLPREVPLSRITPRPPAETTAGEPLSRAEINRNTHGGPLRSQSQEFGWGLGVHGRSELAFDLPVGVRSLRVQVGIDREAGRGGCLRARVFAGPAMGNPLWQSPLLVGSESVADSGVLALAGPPDQSQLVLQIDPAEKDRPAGADPLDIRDHANWCDPLLELDPVAVQAQFDQRLGRRFYAWRDWTVAWPGAATLAGAGIEVASLRNTYLPLPGFFHAGVSVQKKPLVLTRQITVGQRDEWLVISATRNDRRAREPTLLVRIGGETAAELLVPPSQENPGENRPLAISLAGYQRTPPAVIDVEIRQLPQDEKSLIEYRAITTAAQLPTLYRAFEEQADLSAVDAAAPGAATVVDDDRYHGSRAIRITPGGQFRLPLDGPVRIRERPAWGEYRFVRFAVKKPKGGRVAIGFETGEARATPARYDLGKGEPSFGGATRIWQDNPPKDWVVMTRDLFADFGQLDVQAILVGAIDGEPALVDHIYLARGHVDFESIPAAPSPEATNEKARDALVRPIIERARQATVRIEMPDGRLAAGAIILEEGEVLTAGHVACRPGELVRVTLSDGTTLRAKTLGVDRKYDLALLAIERRDKYKRLEYFIPPTLPQDKVYVALVLPQPYAEFSPAIGETVALRRVLPGAVWTDLDVPDWLAGGPLLDRDGKLIGIQTSKSPFGGVNCSRLAHAEDRWKDLRKGQVLGTWPPGSEPVLGLTGAAATGGWLISVVADPSPAAKAGLQVGDIVQRFDGQPLVISDDLTALLSQRDPGQEVTLDLTRAGKPMQLKMKLAPRVP